MSKLRIEHGASKVNFVTLKTNIEESISRDVDLMANWSANDRKYVVNELLRFALTQNEDFLKYKTGLAATPSNPGGDVAPVSSAAQPVTNLIPKSNSQITAQPGKETVA